MPSFLPEHELRTILDRRWSVNCLDMRLIQQGRELQKYSGPGSLRYGEDGGLEYVLYDTQTELELGDVFSAGGTSGEWLNPEDFYRLEATDFEGRTWMAEWLEANTTSTYAYPGAVVRGAISELRCEFPFEGDSAGALFYAPTNVDVPVNAVTKTVKSEAGRESKALARDVWRSSTSTGEIFFKKDGASLKVNLRASAAALPDWISVRLEESLSVLLGTHVRWAIEELFSAGRIRILLRSGVEAQRRPRLRPPIEPRNLDAIEDQAVLLDRLITYFVETVTEPAKYHPLAVDLLRVFRASSSTIEDEALTLSTSVESVISNNFGHLRTPDAGLVEKVDLALKHMDAWSEAPELRDRLRNAISLLKQKSVAEALKALTWAGALPVGHWETWRALRNPAAHGARSPKDIKVFVNQCDVVYDLLLLLLFNLIGFTGRYTNHHLKGWPLVAVPQAGSMDQERSPFDPSSAQYDAIPGEVE